MQFVAFRSNAAGESGTLTLSAKHCGTESCSCHSGSSDAGVKESKSEDPDMRDLVMRWPALVALTLFLISGFARGIVQAQEQMTIHVGGSVSKPAEWTADKLRETFASQLKKVEYTAKGQKHVSTCVPLIAIVQAAEPVTDPKHKNFAMRLAVVVSASDGYAVTFGMGDLMPDVGNREVWLALDADGQSLTGRDAPAKLIVPTDAKPVRAVWGVTKIDVADPTASAK